MTRDDKIKVLQDLQTGAVTLEDLRPKKFRLYCWPNGPDPSHAIYKINDVDVSGEEYSAKLQKAQANGPFGEVDIDVIIDGDLPPKK